MNKEEFYRPIEITVEIWCGHHPPSIDSLKEKGEILYFSFHPSIHEFGKDVYRD